MNTKGYMKHNKETLSQSRRKRSNNRKFSKRQQNGHEILALLQRLSRRLLVLKQIRAYKLSTAFADVWAMIVELQRAKRASEAPWVRKIGNPSSRENLFMTSAYDRASERANVRTDSGGRGRGVSRYSSRSPIRETKECHLSLAVLCLKKSEKHSFLFLDRSGWSNVSR